MAKQVTKKEWTEPELIVLVRSKPEEAVLAVCKLWNKEGAPYSDNYQCESVDHICGSPCSYTIGS